MKKYYTFFLISFAIFLFGQLNNNGHIPTTQLPYNPLGYTNSTMRQGSSVNNANNPNISSGENAIVYVNFTYDTTGKSVYLVYTTNGTNPSKTNGTVVNCTFSKYLNPDRTFVGTIPSTANTAGTTVKYLFYISNSLLANASGRIASNTNNWGYQTSWTEGDNAYSYMIPSASSISLGSISGSPFCAGSTISVPYTATGTFNSGNQFTAQLSDASGSFASPISTASVTSTTSGTISLSIPSNAAYSTAYKVRVVSSNPSVTSNESAAFTIHPIQFFANLETPNQTICSGNNITNGNVTGRLYIPGITNSGGQGSGVTVQFGYANTNDFADNTHPSNWPNWTTATYKDDGGTSKNDDRYTINDFGSALSAGTYYYTFRYKVGSCDWVYGGYNSGNWNGIKNVSGTLTVNSTPSITTQPSTTAQIVCHNAGATALTVAATGLGLSYQWYSNSSAANSGGTLISGATSSSYKPLTSSVGTQYYYVVVSTCGTSVTSNVSGAIVVNTYSAALSSAVGTDNQTVLNDASPITSITYALENISAANVTGLPTGVTGSLAGNTYTISGAPTQVGTFNYSISFTANCGTVAKLTGKIQVNSYLVEYANIQSPKKPQTILLGEQFDVYAQVKITGITDAKGHGSGASAWLGYSLTNTNPNTWTNWTAISYNPNYDTSPSYQIANDEYYYIDFVNNENLEGGTYYYASRFQRDGTSEYTYGGTDEVNTNSSGGIWGTTNANGKLNVSGVVKVVDEVIWDGTQWKWFDDDEGTSGAWKTIVGPNQKLKAKIEGNYPASAPSFTCKKLTIDNGVSVTIGAGKYIQVINEIVNNNASASQFTVESDGGLIQVNDASVNTGNITVKRNANLKRLDYNYWGSPVENQNLKTFSPGTLNSRFYTYNEADDFFYWIDPTINTFQKGKGYAIRARNAAPLTTEEFNGVFLGQPHNGSFNLPLAYSDGTHGHNLISNPYPSNIDFDALYDLGTNSDLIYKTAYFWTNVNPNPEMQGSQYPKTGSINNYAVYSGTGGLSAPYGFVSSGLNTTIGNNGNCPTCKVPNNIIKVGQGFIVKTKQLGSLAFNNTIRSNDGKGKFFNRITAPKKDRFWLELKTPLNFVNPILIGYVSGATDAFELDYDAPLMVEGADSFYSILGTDKLAIQGKKYPMDLNDAIPLGATFYETGTHTISLVNKDGVFTTGQPIYLHDKLLNLYTDLQKQDYVFIADKGETKDRFEITYQPESTLSISNLEKEKVKIYYQEKDIVIEAYKTINEILIYDVSGKLIKSIKPKSKQLLIENSVLSNGVNVISIIFANEKINTKVISR